MQVALRRFDAQVALCKPVALRQCSALLCASCDFARERTAPATFVDKCCNLPAKAAGALGILRSRLKVAMFLPGPRALGNQPTNKQASKQTNAPPDKPFSLPKNNCFHAILSHPHPKPRTFPLLWSQWLQQWMNWRQFQRACQPRSDCALTANKWGGNQ